MPIDVQSTFNSICSYCGITVQTKTEQINNLHFICSKECRQKKSNSKDIINLDNKYGPKIIPKYSNNYIPLIILSFLPKYWFQNDIRCNKCYKRFYSDDIPDYCDKCIYEKIPIDTNCISCSKKINGTPSKLKTKKNMCIDCFNLTDCDFICTYCNTTFVDTHNTYNDLNCSICHSCRNLDKIKYKYVHSYQNNDTINKLLDINPNLNIRILYKVMTDNHNHDIDCSDYIDSNCTDSYCEIDIKMKEFPLLNKFYNSELLMNNKDFHYFYTPKSESICHSNCDNIIYEIENFEIHQNI
jgi:hypothetical protein